MLYVHYEYLNADYLSSEGFLGIVPYCERGNGTGTDYIGKKKVGFFFLMGLCLDNSLTAQYEETQI